MRRVQSSLLALTLAALAVPVHAERPNAMRLYPSRTVFFVRAPAVADLLAKISGSPFFQDPEVRPFIDTLFGKVDTAFREGDLGEATGGGLAETIELFQGEVAFGVTPRSNEGPGVLLLADTLHAADREAGDPAVIADADQRIADLLEAMKAKGEADGMTIATESVASAEAAVFRRGENSREASAFIAREGVILFSNDKILLESVISKWDQAEGAPSPLPEQATDESAAEDEDAAKRIERLRRRYASSLSENRAFTESTRECVEQRVGGGDTSPPDLTFFLDPVGVFRSIAQRNNGMRFALATFPILGLDGIEGGAGAAWIDHGEWDALFRGHLLLDNPRAGVLKMVRLTPVDPQPGDAIPANLTQYLCGGFDFASTLEGAGKLYDKIRGEGEFATLVEREVSRRAGVTPEQVLQRLTGRFVSVQAYGEPPEDGVPRVAPARAVLLDVEEPEWFDDQIDIVLKGFGLKHEWIDHGDGRYATFLDLNPPEGDGERARNRRRQVRRLEASGAMTCVAVIGDQLAFSQTSKLMEKLIDTHSGLQERLADSLPYRLTAKRASRLGRGAMGTDEGLVLIYDDPAAQMERWVLAAESESSRTQLDDLAERAPPMRWLRDTLEETGFPSLDALMRHAAPSGSAIFDTPRGIRFVGFSFKASTE